MDNPTPLISFNCNPKVFITKLRSTKKVSASVISDIQDAILSPASHTKGLAQDTHSFFEEALTAWPLSECVAPLFLLRAIAAHAFFPAHYFNVVKGGGSGSSKSSKSALVEINKERVAKLCDGLERQILSKDKVCSILGTAVLMNLFATKCGKALVVAQRILRSVFSPALDMLDSDDPEIRKMAAALAYNYASLGPFKDEALGATCTFRLSVAILKNYPKKSVSQDASIYSLAAFKYMLVNNPSMAKTVSKNPQLTSHVQSLVKARGSPKINELAKELCTIMNIPLKAK